MVWMETCVVDERMQSVIAAEKHERMRSANAALRCGGRIRQRSAICLARCRRAVATVGQGDQGRRAAGADCAWQATAEWPA